MFNIVLLEPEIPANTLNIGRTCVCSNTKLHLIEPLGYQITNKKISRAGLDYWDRLNYKRYSNLDDFMNKNKITRNLNNLWLVTTKGQINFSEVKFNNGDFLLFGKESKGIPEEILCKHKNRCIRIPMATNERSLNLSNSVAICLYEALRQNNFLDLKTASELHNLSYLNL